MTRVRRRCGGAPCTPGAAGGTKGQQSPSHAPLPPSSGGASHAARLQRPTSTTSRLLLAALLLCGVAEAQVLLVQFNPVGAHSTKELMPATYCFPGITCGTLRWGPAMTTSSNNIDVLPFGPWPTATSENVNAYVNFTVRVAASGVRASPCPLWRLLPSTTPCFRRPCAGASQISGNSTTKIAVYSIYYDRYTYNAGEARAASERAVRLVTPAGGVACCAPTSCACCSCCLRGMRAGTTRNFKYTVYNIDGGLGSATVAINNAGFERVYSVAGMQPAHSATTRLTIYGGPSSPDYNDVVSDANTPTITDQGSNTGPTLGIALYGTVTQVRAGMRAGAASVSDAWQHLRHSRVPTSASTDSRRAGQPQCHDERDAQHDEQCLCKQDLQCECDGVAERLAVGVAERIPLPVVDAQHDADTVQDGQRLGLALSASHRVGHAVSSSQRERDGVGVAVRLLDSGSHRIRQCFNVVVG